MYFSNEMGQYNNINFYTPWEAKHEMKYPFDHFRCIFENLSFSCRYIWKSYSSWKNIKFYMIFFSMFQRYQKAVYGIASGNVNDEEYLNGFYADHGWSSKYKSQSGSLFVWPLYVFVYILRHNILLQIIKIRRSDIWIAQK